MTRATTTSGTTLADLRRMAGMTQLQVADKMGCTRGRVSQVEAQFPDLMFTVVQSYLKAVGACIEFVAANSDGEVFLKTDFSEDAGRAAYAASRKNRFQSIDAA